MKKINDERLLPKFVLDALEQERQLFPDSTFPQTLGSTGYKVYHLGNMFWGWDMGTCSQFASDGRLDPNTQQVAWIRLDELDVEHPVYEKYSRRQLVGLLKDPDEIFDEALIKMAGIAGSGVEIVHETLKVMIVYENIPESTLIYVLDVSREDWEWIQRTHLLYVNGSAMTKEQTEDCMKLYDFLQGKESYSSNVAYDVIESPNVDKVIQTGFVL